MKSSNRVHIIDQYFDFDIEQENYSNHLFLRVAAKGKSFKDVDFRYTIFDTCYFRKCKFVSCDFVGCRFVGTSMVGSLFCGCKFDYTFFERTLIDSSILDVGCPGFDNVKLRFARALRSNYQSLGDLESVKKAFKVELAATESHLYKAWKSGESYYREKYKGWTRIAVFFRWLKFKVFDFIWGNGESARKLAGTVFLICLCMALCHTFKFGDPKNVLSYFTAFCSMPEIFLGVSSPAQYSSLYLALICFIRLIAIGMFLSILIKRLGRR